MKPQALYKLIAPCGPILDAGAARRALEVLEGPARDGGWPEPLQTAWPALAPVFAASPYLASLGRRDPARLGRVLTKDPTTGLGDILKATNACALSPGGEGRLRQLKGDVHLLTALADLGGLWDLDAVTAGLTRFADAALCAALDIAAREAIGSGRMVQPPVGDAGPAPGLFCLAMGKHGAFELNYSSDIDIVVFYDGDVLPAAPGVETAGLAIGLTERIAEILQTRTADGYVFRVDLRLRPDPASTGLAVPLAEAFNYYESVGQNWERAAFIKARASAGDLPRARLFLDELAPFIWRRNLDFAAIADIHAIKRQIHVHKVDERLSPKGADLKLGAGGIREIEFFVQTQQLILGGRQRDLRSPRTLDALGALQTAGHVALDVAEELTGAYTTLRTLEHRIQMIEDEQTHRLPSSDPDRRRVAVLAGFERLGPFDAMVGKTLRRVNRRYGELFASEETLSSRFGSLIFTGVDDDPQTLATLRSMGFADPAAVSRAIRGWHHGHLGATRTARGRELFTRLAPRVLEAASATGAPDKAFQRFADFFGGLTLGVQVQSLFLAKPRLLELVVRIMAHAPQFARALARRPAALDALLDPAFFGPLDSLGEFADTFAGDDDLETAMNLARRAHAERVFRIGVQLLAGAADAQAVGGALADLADGLIQGLAKVSLAAIEAAAGPFAGDVAVIALGKCGSREMTVSSDLDLMTLYRPSSPSALSALKGWSADTFYARFTQRLISALSAPTGEGGLYEVDLRLRPSGAKGPVAVSLAAFESYYAGEAEVWELLAMTRARVVWATSETFGALASRAIESALRRPRDRAMTAREVREMRALMADERPQSGFWDMKLSPGGLVDIEFAAQHLQLVAAADGGPLRQNTGEALAALSAAQLGPQRTLDCLADAWRLQQDLSQLLNIALDGAADPSDEPRALRSLLAKAGGVRDFRGLKARLVRMRKAAHLAFEAVVEA
ncbi:MAG TPA: bifunctional [glutamine synthetase] adenylyltransferase/[glutamine synthetase]-adenylyl-L-tyrosine phosphorylase [Caulobacteraceae bacterium]